MKRSRAQYRKNWAAASRALRRSGTALPDNNDDSDLDELNFNPSQRSFNSDTDSEQHEPPQKSTCTSPHSNCSSLHDSADIAGVGGNHFTGSSSDSDDDVLDDISFCEGLADWTNKYSIKQNALDGLLGLLKANGHPDLPGCARTLLQTSRYIPIQQKSGMEYVYFPFSEQLLRHFKRHPVDTVCRTDSLEISLNVDGLPLFKSSGKNVWPVLCAIVNIKPIVVFPVVLTCGHSKPNDLEFLEELINDLNDVLKNGIQDGERVLSVTIRCVVCDAPARALVKGTKLCSGYFGCDKCAQKGMWVGRVTYPQVNDLQLRTDLSFREQNQEEHHRFLSPFCNLPVDMVKKFPIDYMHQLCLGVMRKLLLVWIRGNRGVKMSAGQVETVSHKLLELKPFVPCTFARKPRSLLDVDRWKATEFRQFLLYTGKIALKGILRHDLYEHFLVLSVASSILICPSLAQSFKDYAKQLMKYFVEQSKFLYGDEFMVYNVHSMIHLADEVETFGCLDACSSFPFENYMQKLKKMVRSGKSPIAQIAKRISECSSTLQQMNETSISLKIPDNAFLFDDSSCIEVVERAGNCDGGEELFLCRIYEKTEPYFTSPCDSRLIGVHKASSRWTTMKVLSSCNLTKRAMMVDLGSGKKLFMVILHTNN